VLDSASGRRAPTAGSVLIDGLLVHRPNRVLGMTFQQRTLLPGRSVQKKIELGLCAADERRAGIALASHGGSSMALPGYAYWISANRDLRT
jgi:ABC-type nitrate/sulfonate/bicarbonate transport system ATPase subunit